MLLALNPCERNTFSGTFQTKTFHPKRIRKHITCERSMSIRNRIQINAGFLCCRPVCYSDSNVIVCIYWTYMTR